ncbi:hypothetical protein E8E13_003261 [Curvularia kusanoi]|uniref:Uncharacterized protein n=1 Tax=Curvularia kusanoi TaxID=90978 RepID=A0A9P4T648_CURKU|nr:hypothetical protein E8E13_003261 [Curvularia kusanoi]
MSKLLSTALLATAATAQLTTSIWMPGVPAPNQSFLGSVMTVQNDRTILAIAPAGEGITTEDFTQFPSTITAGGTTFVAYTVTFQDPDSNFKITAEGECQRANGDADPTCKYTSYGSSPETTVLKTQSDNPAVTTTMSGEEAQYVNNFKVVITAGADQLSASAAATPTGSGAQSTGGSSTAASVKSSASGSGSAQATGPASTGAAAPMRSMAPVLAGLGAAAAFFV